MDDPFQYGLLLFILLLFIILKSAFGSINPLQLELDKKKKNYHIKTLSFISEKTAEFSIVINLCYYITLAIFIELLSNDLMVYFQTTSPVLFLLVFIIVVGLILFPALILLPKTFGEYFSHQIINLLAVPLLLIYILLYPFLLLTLLFSRTPLKIFYNNDITLVQRLNFSKEDLNKLLEDSQKHSSNSDELDAEIRLFQNALEFSEVKLRECMIPRTEITAVEINEIDDEIQQQFIASGYSKILVYRDNIENIIGYIKSKSLFHDHTELKKHIKNIKYFPESMPANKLLRNFIKSGQNIAVVVDEFGGTSGIITIEDILEEIFGEIQDEHDTEDLYEKKLSETDYILSGRIEIDYLNEKYDINIPESEDYETIAGFILYHIESLPRINDKITIDEFTLSILKVTETRVNLVKLEISAAPS